MTGEEYLAALGQVVAKHPGARVMVTDCETDYHVAEDYEAVPVWSERDQCIYADGSDADLD